MTTIRELDPWKDLAEILAIYRPASGWEGPTPAEVAAYDRLLNRVEYDGSECWLSTFSPRRSASERAKSEGNDHRKVRVSGQAIFVHVLAFAVHNGLSLAEVRATGLSVLHRCDVERCFRAGHLGLGSNHQNRADSTSKGRAAKGETHPHARLTSAQVAAVHVRVAAGETKAAIARDFGVVQITVRYIAAGRIWPESFEAFHGVWPQAAQEAARISRRNTLARAFDRKAIATYGVAVSVPGDDFAVITMK